MCTVSWSATTDGYDLFFNRDELNSRAAEYPPFPRQAGDVAYLAPQDGQRGGTWLGVNEFGLTVCLLNDYGASWQPTPDAPRFSRGHVVTGCLEAAGHAEVRLAVQAQPLAQTAAFQLLALSPQEGPLVLRWGGLELWTDEATRLPLLSSSSFATEEVIERRRMRFAALAPAATPAVTTLSDYHRGHCRTNGAHSVLMRRPDAATRSITHVSVNHREIRVHYQPVRWTRRGPAMPAATSISLARRSRTNDPRQLGPLPMTSRAAAPWR